MSEAIKIAARLKENEQLIALKQQEVKNLKREQRELKKIIQKLKEYSIED